MKKFIVILAALITTSITSSAMSYLQAREQALFLTDKMAYELNLTQAQYDAAYEINLDYLMSVDTHDDLYGSYWRWRNSDLRYILLDWQYRAYCAASYFYRPLYCTSGVWHFAIYRRYPRRTHYYFGRPNIYITYRGGHGWRHNGGRSWYKGRKFNHGDIKHGHGMRDRFDRGDFDRDNDRDDDDRHFGRGHKYDDNRNNFNKDRNNRFVGSRGNGNSIINRYNRESSTRRTAKKVTLNSDVKVSGNDRQHFKFNDNKSESKFTPKRIFKGSTDRTNVKVRQSSGNRTSFSENRRVSGSTTNVRRFTGGSSFNGGRKITGGNNRNLNSSNGNRGRFGGSR